VTEPTDPEPDDLDWDPERDGRMADEATGPDEEPPTEPYDPEDTER
jgi:hypothetical protein